MNCHPIMRPMKPQMSAGAIGVDTFKVSTWEMMMYEMNAVKAAMFVQPKKTTIAPIELPHPKRAACLIINVNAFQADVQNDVP